VCEKKLRLGVGLWIGLDVLKITDSKYLSTGSAMIFCHIWS